MAELYRFSVAYEPATMQSAVRAYMLRALTTDYNWVSTAAAFVVVVGVGIFVFARDFDVATGLFAGLILSVLMLILTLGWLHWRATKAKLARMKQPRAEFIFSDELIEVRTDQGAGSFPWAAIRQIWKFERVWLLMMDLNRFLTLPLADAPAEALQFLDRQVQPRPFKAA